MASVLHAARTCVGYTMSVYTPTGGMAKSDADSETRAACVLDSITYNEPKINKW